MPCSLRFDRHSRGFLHNAPKRFNSDLIKLLKRSPAGGYPLRQSLNGSVRVEEILPLLEFVAAVEVDVLPSNR
jgi:hypothetical protein